MKIDQSRATKISPFQSKINIQFTVGRFTIKTLSSLAELRDSYELRYQVFQVEMVGSEILAGEDHDEFDLLSDHLAIFETKTKQMIATCRLNCSIFSSRFYSEQEFDCESLIRISETKLEIGRVCVHRDFRRGIVIMLLWKAIAEYMVKTGSRFLFGCGSVATQDPREAALLYRYLQEEGKVRTTLDISPTKKYQSVAFDTLLKNYDRPLDADERSLAKNLLPSLCRSYFDIGCFTPCKPAFDREFGCIDFLTLLDVNELNSVVRRKLLGLADS